MSKLPANARSKKMATTETMFAMITRARTQQSQITSSDKTIRKDGGHCKCAMIDGKVTVPGMSVDHKKESILRKWVRRDRHRRRT